MKATLKTGELIRVIKALKPFTGKSNPYNKPDKMEYIYVEFNHETQEAKFEALDGHRIAIEYVKCSTEESFSVYLKPFTPWKTDTIDAEIDLDGKIAIVDMGYYSIKFLQPEGIWYDTKKMIDAIESENPISKIGINPEFLSDALKNINQYGCRGLVIIEIREDKRSPVIVRESRDRRNLRYILPINIQG